LSKTSRTEAGQIKPSHNHSPSNANNAGKVDRTELIDAINQVFALFRVNFHNQYYKAFPDDSVLNQVKKLWFDSLQKYNAQTILGATKKIIEETEYLPTLHQMLTQCAQKHSNAPSVHRAYVEACEAPSPKQQYRWSHPAVYESGRRANWYFLSTTAEQIAFPIFKTHYQEVLSEWNSGKEFALPSEETLLPKAKAERASKEDALKHLKKLKTDLNF